MSANRAPAGRRRWLAAAALGLLAACTSLPPAPPASSSAGAALAGRFSLAVTHWPGGALEKRENWTGRFALASGAGGQTLELSSPLGATLARIESGPAGASLSVPDGEQVRTEHGSDVQALCERVLGWSLPLAGLPDWAAGRPVAGRPFRVLAWDESGAQAPARFEQDDWTVSVARADGGSARRVQIERAAQGEAPQIELRVVLDAPAEAATGGPLPGERSSAEAR